MLIRCLAVGIGGFFGSILRYLITKLEINTHNNFPINTLMATVLGAIMIGIIIAESQKNGISQNKLLFLKFGLCGGLTTFSTFSYEIFEYFENGNAIIGIVYAIISLILCLLGVMIGIKMV